MTLAAELLVALLETLRDVVPIVVILGFFQLAVLRRPIPQLQRVLVGLVFVLVGLALFLIGLERALFPIGRSMARQFTDPGFIGAAPGAGIDWTRYGWVYVFAFALGFTTTIAEPALIAVTGKARALSGGALSDWGLRIAVALGVGFGIALGVFRIVIGAPIQLFIIVGYVVVMLQTLRAPRLIVPLAYDSGGVTTSTVTVPLVAALGFGLAENVPGRSPLIDGFGLIALASLFPMISVMGYAQLAERRSRRRGDAAPEGEEPVAAPAGQRGGSS